MNLDYTPEQFQQITESLSERILAGDQTLEDRFNAIAMDPGFNQRFVEAAVKAGLDPSTHAVQMHVRAIVISFFLYGMEIGKLNPIGSSPSKFVN